ncbi:MAG: hypothetical protein IPJ75_01445 [Ignavibacteriales bacterium]|nr:hypothetical protein [Ignavibacteriales bacterium]
MLLVISFTSPDITAQRKKNNNDINHDSIVILNYGKPVYGTQQGKNYSRDRKDSQQSCRFIRQQYYQI